MKSKKNISRISQLLILIIVVFVLIKCSNRTNIQNKNESSFLLELDKYSDKKYITKIQKNENKFDSILNIVNIALRDSQRLDGYYTKLFSEFCTLNKRYCISKSILYAKSINKDGDFKIAGDFYLNELKDQLFIFEEDISQFAWKIRLEFCIERDSLFSIVEEDYETEFYVENPENNYLFTIVTAEHDTAYTKEDAFNDAVLAGKAFREETRKLSILVEKKKDTIDILFNKLLSYANSIKETQYLIEALKSAQFLYSKMINLETDVFLGTLNIGSGSTAYNYSKQYKNYEYKKYLKYLYEIEKNIYKHYK